MPESDQPHSRQEEPDDPAETPPLTSRTVFRLQWMTVSRALLGSSVFVPKPIVLTRL